MSDTASTTSKRVKKQDRKIRETGAHQFDALLAREQVDLVKQQRNGWTRALLIALVALTLSKSDLIDTFGKDDEAYDELCDMCEGTQQLAAQLAAEKELVDAAVARMMVVAAFLCDRPAQGVQP